MSEMTTTTELSERPGIGQSVFAILVNSRLRWLGERNDFTILTRDGIPIASARAPEGSASSVSFTDADGQARTGRSTYDVCDLDGAVVVQLVSERGGRTTHVIAPDATHLGSLEAGVWSGAIRVTAGADDEWRVRESLTLRSNVATLTDGERRPLLRVTGRLVPHILTTGGRFLVEVLDDELLANPTLVVGLAMAMTNRTLTHAQTPLAS